MIYKAPAKINIGLDIVSKGSDGFHRLESLFAPLPFFDLIEFSKSSSFELTNTGISVDCVGEENLLYMAWRALHKRYNIPALTVHLHKQIPYGAGLGGGSSDATTFLMALNAHFQLKLTREDLYTIAKDLGSDCPFFLYQSPMLVKGTGDVIEPAPISLQGLHYALFVPDTPISTPWAYKQITPSKPEMPLKKRLLMPIEQWQTHIQNAFEPAIFREYPKIGQLKTQLIATGAEYVSLSGSGSAVYALSKKPIEPDLTTDFPLVSHGQL